jgi:LCP family protein required for cell wall assembly
VRSAFVPGWGQLVTNRIVSGRILVFVTGLLVIAGLTVFLFVEPIELAAWIANPDVLLGIVLANLVVAIIRLLSTSHAWVVGGGHRWLVLIVLAVFVAIPHAAIAWVGLETRDSLMKVFPSPASVEAAPAPSTTLAPTTTSTLVPTSTTEVPTTTTTLATTTTTEPEPEEVAPRRPFGEDRLNILLLGGDAGPRRSGLRTDTMIVASIDPVSGDTALIGIPRNFGGITLKDGTEVPVKILNAVYGWGKRQPDRFEGPDPGASATRDAVENITGLEIDYFMLVDLTGFADLVDAFGGVHIVVPETVDGPLYDAETGDYEMVRIEAGEQFLDGGHALAYARVRHDSTDYVRMGRQRCLLAAMARDADPLQLVARLGDLLAVIETYMSTDVPMDLLPELIRMAPLISSDEIRVIGFDAKWRIGRTSEGAAIPDIERIREAVRVITEDPATASELGATTAGAACR